MIDVKSLQRCSGEGSFSYLNSCGFQHCFSSHWMEWNDIVIAEVLSRKYCDDSY